MTRLHVKQRIGKIMSDRHYDFRIQVGTRRNTSDPEPQSNITGGLAITEGTVTEGAITAGAITAGAVTAGAVTAGAITEDAITEGADAVEELSVIIVVVMTTSSTSLGKISKFNKNKI